MTKVPGLTRQDDRPSVGGANTGRVQLKNPIRDVNLQATARPVDTYSRPVQPNSGPNEFMQLAGALAQISPSLQGFLDTKATEMQKDAEDRANRRIGGMSFEEAKAAVADGSISEMQNPWYKAAFMKQYGERLAYQRVNELTQEYETNFDKNNGDLDGFVRERMAGDLEQYGDNPHGRLRQHHGQLECQGQSSTGPVSDRADQDGHNRWRLRDLPRQGANTT